MNEMPPNRIYFLPILIEKCEVPDILVGNIYLKNIQWYELYNKGTESLIKFIWSDFIERIIK